MVGDWGGAWGGAVTGGCAHGVYSLWARKGPADVGAAGLNAKSCKILWEMHIYFIEYMLMSFIWFYGNTPVRIFLSFFIKNCRIEKPSMNR